MTKYYNELKNHIHNTLAISKADIRKMVDKAVERIVERRIDVLFEEKFNSRYDVQNIIDESIKRKLTTRNWFWGESEDTLDDYIKKEVVKALVKNIKVSVKLDKSGESVLQIINKPHVIKRKV